MHPKTNTAPRGRVRWLLMALIIFPLTFVMSLDRTNIAVSAPTIAKHFHFTVVQMGLILSSFAWTYALFQIPGGILTERLGSRRMLSFADIWWSIWTALTAVGFSVASFVGIRGLLGIGQATDWSASVNSIKRWFPSRERARANSILLGGLYLGPIIGTPLTVAIVEGLGWQWSFYIYGAAGLVMGTLWWVFYRDKPQEHPAVSPDELHYIESGYDATSTPDVARWRDWKLFIANYRFWAFGLQYFFLIFVQSFYTTWLPTYLVKARGFSLTSMGFAASLPWVALFTMVFVTGAWQDRVFARTGSKTKSRTPFAVMGFILAAVFLIIASRVQVPWLMIVFLMGSLGAVGLVQVSIWPTCTDLGGNMTGSVTGWTNFWGNLSGALGPIITALLVALTNNWASALTVIGLAALVGAGLWLMVHPDRPLEMGATPGVGTEAIQPGQ
ncbi:MAG: MFS transporter [Thermaerobacter sp.]|nr:MFS transporter [Thermaerobacter sp.]